MILFAMFWCLISTAWMVFQLSFLITGMATAFLAVLSLAADTCRLVNKLLQHKPISMEDCHTWKGLQESFPEIVVILRHETDTLSQTVMWRLEGLQQRWLT